MREFSVEVAIESVKPIFPLASLFARGEAKTKIRQCDWLKLAGEKIRRKQVGSRKQVENRFKWCY